MGRDTGTLFPQRHLAPPILDDAARQRPGLQSDPLEVIGRVRQHLQQSFRFAWHPPLRDEIANDGLARFCRTMLQFYAVVGLVTLSLLYAWTHPVVQPTLEQAQEQIPIAKQAAFSGKWRTDGHGHAIHGEGSRTTRE
jgi:hypothetical protein